MSLSSPLCIMSGSLLWLIGCANSQNCMRHSDCLPEARCIQGSCLVPTPVLTNAGTAGAEQTGVSSDGGSTATSLTKGGAGGKGGSGSGGTSASAGSTTGGLGNTAGVTASAGSAGVL